MPQSKKLSIVILIMGFLFLTACSFPALGAPTEPSIDPVLTDAARTIEARLTSEDNGSTCRYRYPRRDLATYC